MRSLVISKNKGFLKFIYKGEALRCFCYHVKAQFSRRSIVIGSDFSHTKRIGADLLIVVNYVSFKKTENIFRRVNLSIAFFPTVFKRGHHTYESKCIVLPISGHCLNVQIPLFETV